MKAIRLHIKQNSANYKKEETVQCRMTYPLPTYSTVIGAIHKACGYTTYHPMQVSVQGKYGSLKTKMYKDDCFLNSLNDDRNTLVKMKNPDMLSSAYQVVAVENKSEQSGSVSFKDGVKIKVVNEKLLNEYRSLIRTNERFGKHKNIIDKKKAKLKEMKADENISPEEVKCYRKRIKYIESIFKELKRVKYTVPFSHFRTLAKGPKYYELLCDIELIIHIVADENTMNDIMDNIGNLTAIGRGEDFVEVLECTETELFDVDEDVDYGEADFDVYMPVEYLEINKDDMDIISKTEGGYTGGTKYLMPKDYKTVQLKGGMRKRVFNRVPIIFCQLNYIENGCKGIMLDKTENGIYSVFLA